MEQRTGATVPAERIEVLAYEIPTDGPDGKDSDGTLEWDSTTGVVVLASAAGHMGWGTPTATWRPRT